jgi:hypothetical protein
MMWRLQAQIGIHVCRVQVRPLATKPPDLNLSAEVSLTIIDRGALLKASEDPTMDMSREFVNAALERGDVAFGAFDGDTLASYLWRALKTAPHEDDLWVRVDWPCCYTYKTFTHPNYRGRRLSASVSFFADAYFLERGYSRSITFVEASNMPSLVTSKYTGNEAIGYAGYVKWLGRCFPYRTPHVKQTGFEFFDPSR